MITTLTDLLPSDAELGPGMKALSTKARAFVLALVTLGGTNQARAAAMAGYTGSNASLAVTGSRLAADPRVQEAIVEEAEALMRGSALLAVATALEVMQMTDQSGRTRLSAAKMVLDYSGMQPPQKITVTHDIGPTRAQQIQEVIDTAKRIGLDPKKLLGAAGIEIEGDFTVVGTLEGLEDII